MVRAAYITVALLMSMTPMGIVWASDRGASTATTATRTHSGYYGGHSYYYYGGGRGGWLGNSYGWGSGSSYDRSGGSGSYRSGGPGGGGK